MMFCEVLHQDFEVLHVSLGDGFVFDIETSIERLHEWFHDTAILVSGRAGLTES